MSEQNEQSHMVEQFRESLSTVIDLGYGEDECDPVVTVMFERLVRESVASGDIKKLPFRLPATRLEHETTHAQLLKQATQLQRFVELSGQDESDGPRRSPVMFPFLTALGVSGGIFMLIFHITRLAPAVL